MSRKDDSTRMGSPAATVIRRVCILLLVLIGMSVAAQPVRAQSQHSRLSRELALLSNAVQNGTLKDQPVRVIVRFTQKPTKHHEEKMARLGGFNVHKLQVINGGAFSVPIRSLAKMAMDDEIVSVSPDR
ncbi:MAG TPA: hypothetical protein VFJ47_08635, partial [Terriglobales bacterium]|nr:hypothetical protein [Terriglobales bacterium]